MAIALIGALAGCSLAPAYTPLTLTTPTPPAYKETGAWTPASPGDAAPRGDWWTMYGDQTLDDLERKIETANPDLALALKLAQRATDGAKEPSEKSMFMDTLARVKFMQGSKEEGIALEQKAMAMADDKYKDKFQKTLDSYKKGELPEAE